jgi:hypothetical protein
MPRQTMQTIPEHPAREPGSRADLFLPAMTWRVTEATQRQQRPIASF